MQIEICTIEISIFTAEISISMTELYTFSAKEDRYGLGMSASVSGAADSVSGVAASATGDARPTGAVTAVEATRSTAAASWMLRIHDDPVCGANWSAAVGGTGGSALVRERGVAFMFVFVMKIRKSVLEARNLIMTR